MEKEKPHLPQLLTACRSQVASHMEVYFREKKQQADDTLEQKAVERLSDMAGGGKMLRGALVIIGYSLSGRPVTDNVLDVAVGMEITHTSLLIHDDIMDNDPGRRGKMAMHRQYANDGDKEQAIDTGHYGVSQAISVGIIASFMGQECLIRAAQGSSDQQTLLLSFVQEMIQVGYGQMHDVRYGQTKTEPSDREILKMYRDKTAGYSFALPLMLGGRLAGASEETLSFLKAFGEETGIAYQIRDDELGVFGDEKTLGKPVGSDIRENKKTLLRAKLFAAAQEKEIARLKEIYGSDTLSQEDVDYVRSLHEKHHIQEAVNAVREGHEESARQLVDASLLSPAERKLFLEILDFATGRMK